MAYQQPLPTVRCFLICQDVVADSDDARLVSVIRILYRIRGLSNRDTGVKLDRLCVYVLLSECRGDLEVEVHIRDVTTGEVIRSTSPKPIVVGTDPLLLAQAKIEIRSISFPRIGQYAFELWCRGTMLTDLPLKVEALA